MGETKYKLSGLIRKELSSVKVMILAIMISFGVILSIVQLWANIIYTYEILAYVKDFMVIPYNAQNNKVVSVAIILVWIVQILLFFVQFIPLLFMAYGIYSVYGDARYSGKTKGLKVVGGVMKYHAAIAYLFIGLLVLLAIVCIVGTFGFGNEISEFMGMDPAEYTPALRVLAIVVAIAVVMVSVVYGIIASIYMSLNGNMKLMSKAQQGGTIGRMSMFGMVVMIIVGINNLLSIFSDISASGYTTEDIEMLQETLGGSVAQFMIEMMPSANTQFRVAVIGCAYAFFIGAAQVLGGIILLNIRKKVNNIIEEQEYRSYGGEDFTGSNQC